MNRRTAMMLTMLLGGLAPARPLGPDQGQAGSGSDPAPGSRSSPSARPMPTIRMTRATRRADDPPAGFAHEAGFQWKSYDIARYTKVAQSQQTPQKAIIEWIFRRTGTADWHGEKVAVLCASKTQLGPTTAPRSSSRSARSSSGSRTPPRT